MSLQVTFDTIQSQVSKLSNKIKREWASQKFSTIVAIGGGGYIPARMLRTYMKSTKLVSVSVERYICEDEFSTIRETPTILQWVDQRAFAQLKKGGVLIVDECYDKGITLNFVANKLVSDGLVDPTSVYCAVIHKKKRPDQLPFSFPTLWAKEEENVWITYPWDVESVAEVNFESLVKRAETCRSEEEIRTLLESLTEHQREALSEHMAWVDY